MSDHDDTVAPAGNADGHASQRALARLRNEPERLEGLVRLGLDALLDRPLRELIDAAWLASAVAEGIRAAARSDELERWVARRVEDALGHADTLRGAVGEHVPITILSPLETALGREITPDERIVRVLVDHPSFRELLADLLRENLLAFGKRLRSMVPEAARPKKGGSMGFASALAGVAKGVASAVGEQVEKQLEDRVKQYVEDVLTDVVNTTIERISDPSHAPAMARWRIDVLHGLLEEPLEHLVAERHKYPAELFAGDISRILRALAGWRQLTETVEGLVGHLFEHYGDQSARQFLDGSGLDEAWRPHLETLLTAQATTIVASDTFETWLADLLAD